jgi:dienelactone hydrolase
MSVNIYNARHGFDKPTSKNYAEPAQKASWQKSRQFLNKHLK